MGFSNQGPHQSKACDLCDFNSWGAYDLGPLLQDANHDSADIYVEALDVVGAVFTARILNNLTKLSCLVESLRQLRLAVGAEGFCRSYQGNLSTT